jgi:N-acetyl sugar amidotransferase
MLEQRARDWRVREAGTYRMCTRCIMDTTDPLIRFDEEGVCNHCKGYDAFARRYLHLDAAGQQELARIVAQMKEHGRGREYDCVMGVSGGVDSTFAAYTVRRLGLRPLAVHMDNGWDSELAVSNIEKVLKRLDIDLYTYVLDWEEFRDLQVAFLRASVSDAEIPTDHAIAAVVYKVAAEKGIRYLISGSNVVTEAILPSSWTYGILDWRYIKAVHRRFGTIRLRRFPRCGLRHLWFYWAIKGVRTIRVLDYVPYERKEVMRVLEEELGWKYYGGKHYESIYTRFFQGYILPRKFDIDKRKAHLSTLVCSGQLTAAQALEEMKTDRYPRKMQDEDKEYVIKKLGLTPGAFEEIMALPVRSHTQFPNSERRIRMIEQLVRLGRRLRLPIPGWRGPL